jgi:hypothetical protein
VVPRTGVVAVEPDACVVVVNGGGVVVCSRATHLQHCDMSSAYSASNSPAAQLVIGHVFEQVDFPLTQLHVMHSDCIHCDPLSYAPISL